MFCFFVMQGVLTEWQFRSLCNDMPFGLKLLKSRVRPPARLSGMSAAAQTCPGKRVRKWAVSVLPVLSEARQGKMKRKCQEQRLPRIWGSTDHSTEAWGDRNEKGEGHTKDPSVGAGLVSLSPLGSPQHWSAFSCFLTQEWQEKYSNNTRFSCVYRTCQCTCVLKSAHWNIQ